MPYVIEDSLQQLAELREQAESEGDSEALKVIDDQLADYLTQEADKVSSYVGLIRLREDQAANCDAELERVKALRDRARADVERLKATALAVMQRFDVKALKDERTGSALTRRGNGGLQPLEVQPESVADQYRLFRITFTYSMWISFLALIGDNLRDQMYEQVQSSPDTQAIRKALAQRVTCPECAEYQDTATGRDLIARDPCPRCNGAGTIQNTVPGARLLERGEHVRLS